MFEGWEPQRCDALGQRPMVTLGLDLKQAGDLHGWHPRRRRQILFSTRAAETAVPRAEHLPNPRSRTPCRDKPRTGAGAGSTLVIFFFFELFFEESLQVDPADSRGGSVEASAHLDLFAYLLHPMRWNVESFGLAVHAYGDLKLRVQTFAVGTMTVGPATGAFAFEKEPGSISRRAPRLRMSLPRSSRSGSRGLI